MGRLNRASVIRIRKFVNSAQSRLNVERKYLDRNVYGFNDYHKTKDWYRKRQCDGRGGYYLCLHNNLRLQEKECEVLSLVRFDTWDPTQTQFALVEWMLGNYCKQMKGLYYQRCLPRDIVRMVARFVAK